MTTDSISPYTMEEAPTSVGRVLLARALAHWCAVHHGLDPAEVAAALETDGNAEPSDRAQVRFAARMLGELVAREEIHSWARPLGGGTPAEVPAGDWEIDDYRDRFARSAFDPARPFDRHAPPTHWIFLELADFNRVLELSCADVMPEGKRARPPAGGPAALAEAPGPPSAGPPEDRHLRMPEIVRRTGMSASTVYRRIAEGRFPRQIPMERGNIASWWESEVADWIADPR